MGWVEIVEDVEFFIFFIFLGFARRFSYSISHPDEDDERAESPFIFYFLYFLNVDLMCTQDQSPLTLMPSRVG